MRKTIKIKFRDVFPGQIIKPPRGGGLFEGQALMKLPDKQKMIGGPCHCGDDNWNTVNINANGVFTVHFHPDEIVEIIPGENAFDRLSKLMGA